MPKVVVHCGVILGELHFYGLEFVFKGFRELGQLEHVFR